MTSELDKFLKEHNALRPATKEAIGYIITYNGYKCHVDTSLYNGMKQITIRPLSNQWDIGAGCGGAVYKTFHK